MEIVYALPLLAALFYALHVVRRIVKRNKARRRLLHSAIGGDARFRFRMPKRSPRSEMRANDDPSTVMKGAGTTTSSPGTRHSRTSKKRRK
jgi:hypothetical protein